MKSIEIAIEILNLERIEGKSDVWRGIYTLGLQSNPRFLTVGSQQRRARQLAVSLFDLFMVQKDGEPRSPRIAIIGGGFGGLTLAACLAEQKPSWQKGVGKPLSVPWEISVFERQNQLVPIQRGCSIRKLHPAIHTWPATDCFDNVSSSAAPDKLLGWSAASAEVVAARFVDEVLLRHRKVANTDKWDILQSAKVKVLKSSSPSAYQLMFEGQRVDLSSATPVAARGSLEVDVVVFATGFGVERSDVDQHIPMSYWRNDDLGQAPLYGQKQRFVISGAGDGALTDLFRLCLYDFSYDVVMKKVLPVEPTAIDKAIEDAYERIHPNAENSTDVPRLQKQYKDLLEELRKPKRRRKATPPDVFAMLEEYWENKDGITKQKIQGQALGYLTHGFLTRLCKQDVQVIIQVLPEFAAADPSGHPLRALVNNPKSMLYNRVMAYLLWRVGAFETVAAPDSDAVVRSEQWEPKSVTTIVRHGAAWNGAVLDSFIDGLLKQAIFKKLKLNAKSQVSDTVQAYQLGRLSLQS